MKQEVFIYINSSAPTYNKPMQRYPVKELMVMQSKGKYLTPDEKNTVTLYAQQQRIKNLKK